MLIKSLFLTILLTHIFLAFGSEYSFSLIDGYTGNNIMNTEVRIKKTNTIRCVTVPCPGNETEYITKTNDQSILDMSPYKMHEKDDLIIIPNGYHGVRFSYMSKEILQSEAFQFNPTSLPKDMKKLRFLDDTEGTILTHRDVYLMNDKSCLPPKCKEIIYQAKTNSLGNIYYPHDKAFPQGLAQTTPIWIYIKGFEIQARHHHHNDIEMKLRDEKWRKMKWYEGD